MRNICETMEKKNDIGARIEAARKAAKLTQTELAVRIFGDEKKRDLIKHWEIGDRQIKVDHLALLCKVLNVSADFIIGLHHYSPEANLAAAYGYYGLSFEVFQWLYDCPIKNIKTFVIRVFGEEALRNCPVDGVKEVEAPK